MPRPPDRQHKVRTGRKVLDETHNEYRATERDPADDPLLAHQLNPPLRVWVEGEWVIPARDGAERVAKDQLAQILRRIPDLKLYVQPLVDEKDTTRRQRHQALAKLARGDVVQYLQDYPGAMIKDIADYFYGDADKHDYGAALARVRTTVHRLVKDGRLVLRAGCYYPVHRTVTDENDKRIVSLANTFAANFPDAMHPIAFWGKVAEIAQAHLAAATTVRTYIAPEAFTRMLNESFGGDAHAFAEACRHNPATVEHWATYGVRGARKVSMVLDFMRNPDIEVLDTLVNSRTLVNASADEIIDQMRGAPAPGLFEPLPTPSTPVSEEDIAAAFFSGKKDAG